MDGHTYIVVVVEYFTKWAEAIPTFRAEGETTALFLFNQVIYRFGVPLSIATDHGSHFQNHMMTKLTSMIGFQQDQSSSYYSQANGQVEVVNGVLKTMVHRLVDNHKTTWHRKLYSMLWAYRTSVKTTTGFTPFQIAFGLEVVLPIECDIPSLKLVVEFLPDITAKKEWLLSLDQLDETCRDATLALEAHQCQVKAQYEKSIMPRSFQEGELVLLYDQRHDLLGERTLQTLWLGPYIITKFLSKGAYELQDCNGIPLAEPHNGLYLKKYFT